MLEDDSDRIVNAGGPREKPPERQDRTSTARERLAAAAGPLALVVAILLLIAIAAVSRR